jgi:hypothetical protein
MADLPHTGFTRTALRGNQGVDWHRNIFWLKGAFFALVDEVTAREPDTYYVESNMSTCPTPAVRWVRFTPRSFSLLPGDGGFEVTFKDKNETKHYMLASGPAKIRTETYKAQDITKTVVRQVRERARLGAGQTLTFVNLMYGDRRDDRRRYRLKRIGPTEGLIVQDGRPVAYFGTSQSGRAKAALAIDAKMFLLTSEVLAIVDGTSAGEYHRSGVPVSREIAVPPDEARRILTALAGIAGM